MSDINLPFVDAPNDFFDLLNRGGLKAPGNELYILLCNAYEIFCKLKMSPQFDSFLRLKNPRDSFVSTATVKSFAFENDILHSKTISASIITRLMIHFALVFQLFSIVLLETFYEPFLLLTRRTMT